MVNFDSPSRENCVIRETRTNTPLQALNLMNDVTYVEAARKLAERMLIEGGSTVEARVRHGFRLTLAREPQQQETQVLAEALERFRAFYAANGGEAASLVSQGDSTRAKKLDVKELAAYSSVASLLLNLDETVTKE
jgi:hypothetical protein